MDSVKRALPQFTLLSQTPPHNSATNLNLTPSLHSSSISQKRLFPSFNPFTRHSLLKSSNRPSGTTFCFEFRASRGGFFLFFHINPLFSQVGHSLHRFSLSLSIPCLLLHHGLCCYS